MEIKKCLCVLVLISLFNLADNIAVTKDVWIVGDKVLHEIFYTLPSMRRQAKANQTEPPYLFNHYNVTAYTMGNSLVSNMLTRVLDSFIKGINKHKMPKNIITILNRDLVNAVAKFNQSGSSGQIAKCVNWLSKKFEQIINQKKDEMCKIRAGSITNTEPNMIWVKMLVRPSKDNLVLKLANKFNAILEEELVSRKNSFIIDPNEPIHKHMFDLSGDLTNEGKITYWKQINQLIKAFDADQKAFKPNTVVSDRSGRSRSDTTNKERHYTLPKPSPRRDNDTRSHQSYHRHPRPRDLEWYHKNKGTHSPRHHRH